MSTPPARLQATFEMIAATRMADVPIVNPRLRVETVGFRLWQGFWVGVLVTPWSINLVLLPGDDVPLQPLRLDETRAWTFASGTYEFMGLSEPQLGPCQMCPLISPVAEFAAHEQAVTLAREIAAALFAEVEEGATRDLALADMVEEARLNGESLARKSVTRRDFLRAPFLGR